MALPSFGRLSSRTNSRNTAHRRRRKDAESGGDDPELTNYLAALTPEPVRDPESTGSGRRFGEGSVYQLRMNHVAGQQLKDLAAERGTSPQALAREWVLERLSWESQTGYGNEQFAEHIDGPDTDQLFLSHEQ